MTVNKQLSRFSVPMKPVDRNAEFAILDRRVSRSELRIIECEMSIGDTTRIRISYSRSTAWRP